MAVFVDQLQTAEHFDEDGSVSVEIADDHEAARQIALELDLAFGHAIGNLAGFLPQINRWRVVFGELGSTLTL